MSTKIESGHAVKIALTLKKLLVDRNILEICQGQLESLLFQIMNDLYPQYGPTNIHYYGLLSKFHHQRSPLILIVASTTLPQIALSSTSSFLTNASDSNFNSPQSASLSSQLATQLAERLNLPTPVGTDFVLCLYDLIVPTTFSSSSLPPSPLSPAITSSSPQFTKFQADCQKVLLGLTEELAKCFQDGKSLIIEGLHLNRAFARFLNQKVQNFAPAIVEYFHLVEPPNTSPSTADGCVPWLKELEEDRLSPVDDVPQFKPICTTHFDSTLDQMHELVLQRLDEFFKDDEQVVD